MVFMNENYMIQFAIGPSMNTLGAFAVKVDAIVRALDLAVRIQYILPRAYK